MHIVADQNIPALASLLADAGSLSLYTERQPSSELLRTADVLLVRSVTRVDHTLLQQAPQLKFIGTATIGTEHLDLEAIAARDIKVVSAPGGNADAVGEYVLTAVLAHFQRQQKLAALVDADVAIVGAGNTGRATGRRLEALGLTVHYYDPPLVAKGCADASIDLHNHWQRVLNADIISCHVPLVTCGSYPTHHLFDIEALQSLHAEQVLINASRGAVIDNQGLLTVCEQGDCPQLLLDVWEGEPTVDGGLLDKTHIATPHIAGHSAEGKVGGALLVVKRLYDFLQRPFTHGIDDILPACPWPTYDAGHLQTLDDIAALVLHRYNIWADDQLMREQGRSAEGFDQLRKNYRKDNPRRQFNNQRIACHNSQQLKQFLHLGFDARSN